MGEDRERSVGRAIALEGGEDACMQRAALARVRRVEDRLSGDLVPEVVALAVALQQPFGEAFLGGGLVDHGCQQPWIHRWADDGGGLKRAARLRRKAGCAREDGVADGGWNPVGRARDHLRNVEGVPARPSVKLDGVEVRPPCELTDGRDR